MNSATDRHAERYGKPLVGRRTARVLIGLAAAVFLAAVAYLGLGTGGTAVNAEMISYEHLADDVIAVDFQVTMDPGTEASCQLQALNKGRAQVGFLEVEIPAQQSRLSAHRVEISTQGQAVTAEILQCSPQ